MFTARCDKLVHIKPGSDDARYPKQKFVQTDSQLHAAKLNSKTNMLTLNHRIKPFSFRIPNYSSLKSD